jgi:hypothetical protein
MDTRGEHRVMKLYEVKKIRKNYADFYHLCVRDRNIKRIWVIYLLPPSKLLKL